MTRSRISVTYFILTLDLSLWECYNTRGKFNLLSVRWQTCYLDASFSNRQAGRFLLLL